MRRLAVLFVSAFFSAGAHATTLPPELKAYDFAEAYYIEDGGVVIVPYRHGFECKDYVQTPEGIRLMPGGTFKQYDPSRLIVEHYELLYLDQKGTRAFFRQKSYRYQTEKLARGKFRYIQESKPVDTNIFYLTQWRSLQWFDFAFPGVEVHPGSQNWRSRPQVFYEPST